MYLTHGLITVPPEQGLPSVWDGGNHLLTRLAPSSGLFSGTQDIAEISSFVWSWTVYVHVLICLDTRAPTEKSLTWIRTATERKAWV